MAAEAKFKEEAEFKAQKEAEARDRMVIEAKAKEAKLKAQKEAEARARIAAEARAKEEAIKAQKEAEARARMVAEAKLKEAQLKAQKEAEVKAKEEAIKVKVTTTQTFVISFVQRENDASLAQFMSQLGLSSELPKLVKEHITLANLQLMSKEDLRGLGISLGPTTMIMNALAPPVPVTNKPKVLFNTIPIVIYVVTDNFHVSDLDSFLRPCCYALIVCSLRRYLPPALPCTDQQHTVRQPASPAHHNTAQPRPNTTQPRMRQAPLRCGCIDARIRSCGGGCIHVDRCSGRVLSHHLVWS